MIRWFCKKQTPETLPQKFSRLLGFHAEMVASTRAAIAQLSGRVQPALLIQNYSHLIGDHAAIAAMRWRQGDDPRPAIAAML